MNKVERDQHTAILREAQLAAGLIGSGVTALGKASHATVGNYHEAFFGISIGIERLCKLLYIADNAIDHGGDFPSFESLKKQGHGLEDLLDICEDIAGRVDQSRQFSERPSTPIHEGIVRVLTAFAKTSRYYNLDFLTKPSVQYVDPVAAWWSEVGEPICELHYNEKRRKRNETQAATMEAHIGGNAIVIHTAETGEPINEFEQLMKRQGSTKVVQRYGRLYTLQIVRWLTSIAIELSHSATEMLATRSLSYFHEPLEIFYNEDKMLRDLKTWTLYR